jgi:predicted secreted hydrolase
MGNLSWVNVYRLRIELQVEIGDFPIRSEIGDCVVWISRVVYFFHVAVTGLTQNKRTSQRILTKQPIGPEKQSIGPEKVAIGSEKVVIDNDGFQLYLSNLGLTHPTTRGVSPVATTPGSP